MDTTLATKEPASHMVDAAIENIPLTAMAPWPLNPRQTFDKAAGAELAESIKAQGIITPLLLRPAREKGAAGVKYEIIAGERRWRAAKSAGIAHAPALIRDLTDLEALEINLTEQKQRRDLYPLEEAAGYAKFIELHQQAGDAFNAEQIAAKIGMSRAYVYNRIKLLDLDAGCQKALTEGKLDPSRALLIARIPVPALQKEALKEILDDTGYGDGAMSYRDARQHIQERYMLALSGAPFDMKDAELVQSAGPCTTCPKRTGNQPDLFGDVKSRDVCTDPTCFHAKRQAVAERRLDELKAKGKAVITGSAAAGIVRVHDYFDGDQRITVGGGYVALDDTCRDDPKDRKVREVLGKQMEAVEVVQDPKTKQLVEVIQTGKLKELLNERGIKTTGQKIAQQAKKTRARNEQSDIEEEINRRTVAAIYKKHGGKLDRSELLLVAEKSIDRLESYYDEDTYARVDAALGASSSSHLQKKARAATPEELHRLLLVIGLALEESTPTLYAVAKRLKVDVDKIRREVLAPVKPAAKGKKK